MVSSFVKSLDVEVLEGEIRQLLEEYENEYGEGASLNLNPRSLIQHLVACRGPLVERADNYSYKNASYLIPIKSHASSPASSPASSRDGAESVDGKLRFLDTTVLPGDSSRLKPMKINEHFFPDAARAQALANNWAPPKSSAQNRRALRPARVRDDEASDGEDQGGAVKGDALSTDFQPCLRIDTTGKTQKTGDAEEVEDGEGGKLASTGAGALDSDASDASDSNDSSSASDTDSKVEAASVGARTSVGGGEVRDKNDLKKLLDRAGGLSIFSVADQNEERRGRGEDQGRSKGKYGAVSTGKTMWEKTPLPSRGYTQLTRGEQEFEDFGKQQEGGSEMGAGVGVSGTRGAEKMARGFREALLQDPTKKSSLHDKKQTRLADRERKGKELDQWYGMKKQQITDDVRREMKALELRGFINPKVRYRGAKRGLGGLAKADSGFFQMGVVLDGGRGDKRIIAAYDGAPTSSRKKAKSLARTILSDLHTK